MIFLFENVCICTTIPIQPIVLKEGIIIFLYCSIVLKTYGCQMVVYSA